MIMQKEKQKQMSQLENEANSAMVKSQADAEFYLVQKQAEANKVSVVNQALTLGGCGVISLNMTAVGQKSLISIMEKRL